MIPRLCRITETGWVTLAQSRRGFQCCHLHLNESPLTPFTVNGENMVFPLSYLSHTNTEVWNKSCESWHKSEFSSSHSYKSSKCWWLRCRHLPKRSKLTFSAQNCDWILVSLRGSEADFMSMPFITKVQVPVINKNMSVLRWKNYPRK